MERVQTISPPLGEYEWPTFGITLWDALGGPERIQPPGGGQSCPKGRPPRRGGGVRVRSTGLPKVGQKAGHQRGLIASEMPSPF